MRLQLLLSLAILALFLEEEEDERAFYSTGVLPTNGKKLKARLRDWWRGFEDRRYPMYGTILATLSDSVAAKLYEERHAEIAEIARQECCFVYFRDSINDFSRLSKFDFAEHERFVYLLTEMLNVPVAKLPCLVFFQGIESGKYVLVQLTGQSSDQIISLLRDMFSSIRGNQEVEPFEGLKEFLKLKRLKVTFTMVGRTVKDLGLKVVPDLLKAAISPI